MGKNIMPDEDTLEHFREGPHNFGRIDFELAFLESVPVSILLGRIQVWAKFNQVKRRNFHDGHYWVYNTLEQWREDISKIYSVKTIQRALDRLEELELIVSYKPYAHKRDHTKWYRTVKRGEKALEKPFWTNCPNRIGHSDQIDLDKKSKSLKEQYIHTINTPNKKTKAKKEPLSPDGSLVCDEYQEIYELYPNKGDKERGLKAYEKIRKPGLKDTVLEAIHRQIAERQEAARLGVFYKNWQGIPGYLKNKIYLDPPHNFSQQVKTRKPKGADFLSRLEAEQPKRQEKDVTPTEVLKPNKPASRPRLLTEVDHD